MIYSLLEMNRLAVQPFRLMAETGLNFWGGTSNPWRETAFAKGATAALTLFERATREFPKPQFRIDGVEEQVVWQTPFCNL